MSRSESFLVLFVALLVCACSADGGPGTTARSGPGGGDGDSARSDAGVTDGDGDGMGSPGAPVRCGPAATACADGEECVRDRCVSACTGTRCGDEGLCCTGETVCAGSACVEPGAPCDEESDCGTMETCEPLVERCIPIPSDAVCRYVPPPGVFEPTVQWEWEAEHSMAIPLVVQLTDDDGNGTVDGSDVPDVVALTFPSTLFEGRLTALSGDDGRMLWQTPTSEQMCGTASPAAADLDGDGTVEIVVVMAAHGTCGSGTPQRVAAYSHTGAREWLSDETVVTAYGSIAIADVDANGSPEIVAGGALFDAAGRFRWRRDDLNQMQGARGMNAPSLADVDGDGLQEVIGSNVVYNHDGSELWRRGSVAQGHTAVARIIDSDLPGPQIVAVDGTTFEILDGKTGTTVFGPLRYEDDGLFAGPPTVADFDADGRVEVGIAGDHRYLVFDPDRPAPHIAWSVESQDSTTGSVGSTVFDFDADGSAEVLYADECHLRILSGRDGSLLWHTSNSSITVVEHPVVADVDADGNAEVVAVSNRERPSPTCGSRGLPFSGTTQGIRVFRDALDNWVPTRSIWNQHTYHIDNVGDDGSIPMTEPPSWETHNTYRLNRLLDPSAVTLAPDLVIVELEARTDACPVTATLRAQVRNQGARGVPAGIRVAFYAGEPGSPGRLLGVASTTRTLLGGSTEWVEVEASDLTLDGDGAFRFHAVVEDDGSGTGAHSECDEDNNTSAPLEEECRGPM